MAMIPEPFAGAQSNAAGQDCGEDSIMTVSDEEHNKNLAADVQSQAAPERGEFCSPEAIAVAPCE